MCKLGERILEGSSTSSGGGGGGVGGGGYLNEESILDLGKALYKLHLQLLLLLEAAAKTYATLSIMVVENKVSARSADTNRKTQVFGGEKGKSLKHINEKSKQKRSTNTHIGHKKLTSISRKKVKYNRSEVRVYLYFFLQIMNIYSWLPFNE